MADSHSHHDHGAHGHDSHDHDSHDYHHDHSGGHDHGHSHVHSFRMSTKRGLRWALAINLLFLVVEVVGGILTNSLALLADAGHMVTDVAALVLALFVASMAERPPTPKRTYGLLRAEVLGAFINGAALVLVVVLILREAWHRFGSGYSIDAPAMVVIAVMGLLANVISAWILFGTRNDNVNTRGAFLHMTADALGSLGAIIAGIVVWTTGWTPVDALASLVIGFFILWGSVGLLSQTVNILLESTPENINYDDVKHALLEVAHVNDVHDLHIWTITSGVPSLSAHLSLEPRCSDSTHWQECLRSAQTMLREKFGIEHSTLQFEPEDYERDGRFI